MKVKIIITKKDELTNWLVIEAPEFAILQIMEEDSKLFYIHPKTKEGVLVKTEKGYNLEVKDKRGYIYTHEGIDREVITFSELMEFLTTQKDNKLTIKFNNFINLKK